MGLGIRVHVVNFHSTGAVFGEIAPALLWRPRTSLSEKTLKERRKEEPVPEPATRAAGKGIGESVNLHLSLVLLGNGAGV